MRSHRHLAAIALAAASCTAHAQQAAPQPALTTTTAATGMPRTPEHLNPPISNCSGCHR